MTNFAECDSRQAAVQAIARLLEPVGWDRFLSDHWGCEFTHLPGEPTRFDSLFGWAQLQAILAAETFSQDDLRFYREGRAVERARYVRQWLGADVLKPGSVMRLAGEGATLILDNVDRVAPAIGALAAACARAFGANTNVNAYAAWRTQPGFGVHWDPQDNLVVQVAGSKAWKVFKPTRLHPRHDDPDKPDEPQGAPIWEGVLRQGEVLYLPRGWWHGAQAVGEPSLHLTITMVPPAGPELLTWIGERLMRQPDFRRNVPWTAAASQQQAYLRRLRDMLVETLEDDLLPQLLAEWSSMMPVANRLDLRNAAARASVPVVEHALVRLAANASLAFSMAREGSVSFHANDLRWHCAPALVPALARLRADRWHRVGALWSVLSDPADRDSLAELLTALAGGGALWVSEPQDVDASEPSAGAGA